MQRRHWRWIVCTAYFSFALWNLFTEDNKGPLVGNCCCLHHRVPDHGMGNVGSTSS